MDSLRLFALILLGVAGGMSLAGVNMAPWVWLLPAVYLVIDAAIRVLVFFMYELPTKKRK